MIAMRVLNALAFSALVASAFASALHRRRRSWALAGVAIATTPMAWYLGGTINPNGTEIAAAIALWATLLALATDDSDESDRRLVTRAGVAGFVLVSMRGLGPGFALVALVAAVLVAAPVASSAVSAARRDARVWSGLVLLGVAATVAWTFVVGLKLDQPEHPTVGFADAFHTLPVILRQSIGAMGTYFLPLPFLLYALWVVLALAGIVAGVVFAANRARIAIGLVALATILLPITTDGYNIPDIGFPWQGRYGLPLTVGLVILTCWVVDAAEIRRRAIGAVMVAAALLGQLVAYIAISRRLGMVRVEGLDVLDFVLRPRWEPSYPPALLLAGMVLAVVGLLVLAVPAAAARPDSRRPPARRRSSSLRVTNPSTGNLTPRWTGGSTRISRRTGTSAPSTGTRATRPRRRSASRRSSGSATSWGSRPTPACSTSVRAPACSPTGGRNGSATSPVSSCRRT